MKKTFFFLQSEVCKVLSSGVVLVIDITWDPTLNEVIGSLRANNVPYIHIDVSIKPFARAFFRYIDFINSYDVAMILQNEKGILSITVCKFWRNSTETPSRHSILFRIHSRGI